MCVCVLGIKKKKSLPPDVDCNEDDGNSGHEHGAKYRDDIDDSLGRITRWLPWWRRRFNFNSICQKKKATGRCQSRRQNNVCRNVVATTIRKQIGIKVYETRRDK